MQFHKSEKGLLHQRYMISGFSFMEIVWPAFFHKPKYRFLTFRLQPNTSDNNLGYSYVGQPEVWPSRIKNALETAWNF